MTRFDLLTMLMYGVDLATRPTMSNLMMGYESWLHYNRLHPSQLSRLRSAGLIERTGGGGEAAWALRLTEKGRLKALGGRDPELCWGRAWDGVWRMLMFDIPLGNDRTRRKLYTWLRSNHFGCLQKSAWISPDRLDNLDEVLKGDSSSVAQVVVMDARPHFGPGETNVDFVKTAWDFDEINERYQDYMDFSGAGIPAKVRPAAARDWVGREQSLWSRAVRFDPLLPEELLPRGYLGKKAWQAHRRLLKKAAPMAIALKAK